MLPDLKVFIPKSVYVLTGRYLNALCDRILRQTPLEGNGIDLEETKAGIIPHARAGAIVAAPDAMTYGFQVSWKGAGEVTVAAGIVAATDWGSPDWTNPRPVDWLAEIISPATDLTVSDGDSIWLEILNPKADSTRIGQLTEDGAIPKTVTPGGGGGGGEGGGGGGGGDAGGYGGDGASGADAVGGAPGTGGRDTEFTGDSPGEGDGTAVFGGIGGTGGVGGAGEVVLFTHYTHIKLRARRYTTFSVSLSASASKPSVASTNIAVRIATVSGGIITQHHAGTYHQTLPTSTFIV